MGVRKMQITTETELTRQTWNLWKTYRIKPHLTWLELHKLAEHLTKQCKDHQQIDFRSLIDSQLSYYENLDNLDLELHMIGIKNLDTENDRTGTEKLKHKLENLRKSYRHMQKRLAKQKRINARLKAKLKRKQGVRKRRCK